MKRLNGVWTTLAAGALVASVMGACSSGDPEMASPGEPTLGDDSGGGDLGGAGSGAGGTSDETGPSTAGGSTDDNAPASGESGSDSDPNVPPSDSDPSEPADESDPGSDPGSTPDDPVSEPPTGDGSEPEDDALGTCMGGSTEPCGTFVTISGTEIELGPYGAVMEPNVGEGFETTLSPLDTDESCAVFAGGFGEDQEATDRVVDTSNLDLTLHTVYRPANWVQGETYPIITWGNGTCAQPEGYGALLRHVASHGFFVVAANSRYVGSNDAMIHALDFAFAANEDPESPYYQRLDTSKVGAMGHSQGSGATAAASSDSRIQTVILFNGGSSASKPFLAVTGDYDIGNPTADGLRSAIQSASSAAFIFYHMVPMTGNLSGHLTLMTEPERVVDATTGWFQYMLNDDQTARELFIGDDCGLCGRDEEFEYGQNGLP